MSWAVILTPMIINGIDNQTVELKINNYQFPNSLDREHDGNWLQIYLSVKSKVGNWQTSDPSLMTCEVRDIIVWFKCLSEKIKPKWKEQEFI